MIIHNPVITGSLQVNGSSVASIESLDSTSGSVAALNNATSSYALIAEISGSTTALSSSLEGRISDNETSVSSLNSASSSYALENSISGSFTSTSSSLASELLKNTTDTLTGDLTVTGTITAQEFHTEYVSASIIYESGSTQFGDSDDDTHIFTGDIGVGTDDPYSDVGYTSVNVGGVNGGQFIISSGSGGSSGRFLQISSNNEGSDIQTIPNIPLRFLTSTTEKMRIEGGGNVGIGTAYPSSSLHVYDSTASRLTIGQYGAPHYTQSGMAYQVIRATSDNAARALLELHSGNQLVKANVQAVGANNTVYFGALTNSNASYGNDVEAFYFNTAGNVGLGTTNNTHKLVVKGTSAALTSDSAMRFFIDRVDATQVGSLIFSTGGASISNGWAEIGQTDANGDLYFKANASAASYDTRMIIKGSNGRVGIGTISPAGDLEISGSGNSNRTITFNPGFNDDISISTMGVDASGWNAVTIGQANSQNNSAAIRFKYAGAGSSSNYLGLGFYANDDKLVITPAGNVGIGTTSPNAILHAGSTGTNAYSSTITKGSNMKGIVTTVASNTDDMVGIYFGTGTTTEGTHWSGITGARSDNSTHWGTQLNFYTHNNDVANVHDATQKMVIMGDGNVGVGTTTPGRKLTVTGDASGDANNLLLSNENDTDGDSVSIGFSMLSNNTYVKSGIFFERTTTQGRGSLHLAVNNEVNGNNVSKSDAKLTIINNGNVGIGTASPGATLSLGNAGGQRFYVYEGGSVRSGLGVDMSGSSRELSIFHSTSDGSNGDISFGYRFDSNGVYAERMRLTGAGKLGINTTNPQGLLNINLTENNDSKLVRISGASNIYKDLQWKDTTSGEMWIWSHRTDSLGNAFEAWYNNGTSWNSTSTLSLRTDGNVGLGTESSKAQLHINSGGSYNNTDNNNRLFIEYSAGSPYILFSSPDDRDQGIHFHNTTDNSFVGRIAYQHRSSGDKLWFRIGTPNGNGQFLFDSDGLKFNGDTAAANGLDDYEEGTFTPVVGDGTYTYTNRRGHYVKIGNMVYVHIGFRLATASPGTSTGTITGLPFAGTNYGSYQEPHARVAVAGACVTANLSYNLSFYLSNSSSTLYARTSSGNADTPVASNAIWQAGTFIKYSLLYTVS